MPSRDCYYSEYKQEAHTVFGCASCLLGIKCGFLVADLFHLTNGLIAWIAHAPPARELKLVTITALYLFFISSFINISRCKDMIVFPTLQYSILGNFISWLLGIVGSQNRPRFSSKNGKNRVSSTDDGRKTTNSGFHPWMTSGKRQKPRFIHGWRAESGKFCISSMDDERKTEKTARIRE